MYMYMYMYIKENFYMVSLQTVLSFHHAKLQVLTFVLIRQGSLIPETLKEMEENKDFQITAFNLHKMGQAKLTRDERKKRQRALDNLGIPYFHEFINKWSQESGTGIHVHPLFTLQPLHNIGKTKKHKFSQIYT